MLAYVFWHWPFPEVAEHTYQQDLIAYHRTLFANKPDGFYHTRVLQMEQAPWLARSERSYEDWHLVENSAALDTLNERAVSGPCQDPHRLVARWTQSGAGGLYHLISGAPNLALVRFAYRLDKPAGMTYGDFYALLQPLAQKAHALFWTRHMSLGPGPEFCLHCPQTLALPENLPALEIPVKQLCFTLDQQ